MSKLVNAIFFISSFSISFLCLGILKIYREEDIIESVCLFLVFLFLSFISILIFKVVSAKGESINIKIKKIENNSSYLIPSLMFYGLISLFVLFKFDYMYISIMTIILFLLGLVDLHSPINPFLYFCGYRFYKLESEDGFVFTFVSKRDIIDKDEIKSFIKITEYLFFEGN